MRKRERSLQCAALADYSPHFDSASCGQGRGFEVAVERGAEIAVSPAGKGLQGVELASLGREGDAAVLADFTAQGAVRISSPKCELVRPMQKRLLGKSGSLLHASLGSYQTPSEHCLYLIFSDSQVFVVNLSVLWQDCKAEVGNFGRLAGEGLTIRGWAF